MLNKLLVGLIGVSLAVSSGSAFAKDHKKHAKKVKHTAHSKLERQRQQQRLRQRQRQQLLKDQSSLFTEGPTVTTSPYIGIRTAFDASDLIVNLPSMNEDLRLLQQQQVLARRHATAKLAFMERPIVELSGDVVGQAFWAEPYQEQGNSMHDINLADARFDIFAHASTWVLAYISFDFDNRRLDDELSGSGFRIGNSGLFLKRAFLTIGNLDCSPVYFSLGQMYVPFGRYSTSPITTALTTALGQTNARAALLGLSYGGLFVSGYAFNGDSDVKSTGINQWGGNVGYAYHHDTFSLEFGGGFIANLADSTGMQANGIAVDGEFQGFGASVDTEILQRRVPAVDAHMELSYGPFSVNSEYIAAVATFSPVDMAYNNGGARPKAFHVDGTYRFNVCEFPTSFSVAYGFTEQALALNLPHESAFVTLKTSLFKNTIESLEYRYDENYTSEDFSAGLIDFNVNGPVTGPGPVGGGHRNTIVAEVGVYF
ncbi:MAG: LbtU family siderophore porin [Pseudomonadota bacterium]|nr:LbtU family siderophore porin [Pseudomonadota bacterium]